MKWNNKTYRNVAVISPIFGLLLATIFRSVSMSTGPDWYETNLLLAGFMIGASFGVSATLALLDETTKSKEAP